MKNFVFLVKSLSRKTHIFLAIHSRQKHLDGYAAPRLARMLLHFAGICVILSPLLTPSQWEEVDAVEHMAMFIISVAAGVVSYYICKRLDGKNQQ